MKTVVVTSFSPSGYEQYGQRFISTFRQFWPKSVELLVYHEGQRGLNGVNLLELLSCQNFLQRHRFSDEVRGQALHRPRHWKGKCEREGYNFRYDAYRFCRKVFAVEHAATTHLGARLFWVDADVVTFDFIPEWQLSAWLPEAIGLSYLGRPVHYHSECGFVGYNLSHEQVVRFIHDFANQYREDTFKQMDEWHDSFIFDRVRERHSGIPQLDLSSGMSGHVFVQSSLGRYMDHLKGDRKKDERTSAKECKVPHIHRYWGNTP